MVAFYFIGKHLLYPSPKCLMEGGGGRLNINFQRGLFLDYFGQYVEYKLHCIGCFIWYSVESFVLLSHVYVECTNFQRGLY